MRVRAFHHMGRMRTGGGGSGGRVGSGGPSAQRASGQGRGRGAGPCGGQQTTIEARASTRWPLQQAGTGKNHCCIPLPPPDPSHQVARGPWQQRRAEASSSSSRRSLGFAPLQRRRQERLVQARVPSRGLDEASPLAAGVPLPGTGGSTHAGSVCPSREPSRSRPREPPLPSHFRLERMTQRHRARCLPAR